MSEIDNIMQSLTGGGGSSRTTTTTKQLEFPQAEFLRWLKEMGIDPRQLSASELAQLVETFRATVAPGIWQQQVNRQNSQRNQLDQSLQALGSVPAMLDFQGWATDMQNKFMNENPPPKSSGGDLSRWYADYNAFMQQVYGNQPKPPSMSSPYDIAQWGKTATWTPPGSDTVPPKLP